MAAFRDFVGRMSFAAVAPPGPRLTFRALPLALLFCALTASGPARAGPEGGQVISGTVDIVRTSPERLDIVQDSDKAIIDWRSFSIDAGEHAHFEQPSSSSITLNRVTGGAHSSIFGRLTANGRIMLINPNGILFGGSASVDVGGLVATTIDIRDEDFMAGRFNFDTGGSAGGTVVNRGTITAAEGGLVALVAPGVENSGVIRARLGRVTLASGNSFTLDLHGDGLIRIGIDDRVAERLVAADGAELKALVGNSGTIGADGGVVVLLAAGAAKDVVDYAINMEGIVEARSAEERNGGIVLRGTGEGVIRVTGTLDASGRGRGETGGSVKVLGEKVGVVGEARLDASGEAGGGEILVGGNFQGRGPERNADYTAIGEGVVIRADAISGGDGGRVIVWSDRVTRFFGTITARGGSDSGDGGFAEVSGKRHLQFAPTAVDLSAPHGSIGELLLDPRDILISDSDGSDTDTTPGTDNGKISATDTVINFGDDAGTDYEIQPSAFEAINADVTLQAERDITVSSPIDRSGAADSTLTLQAGRHLTINAAITGTNGAHSFIFEADSPRSGSNDGIGKLTIGASGAITSNNGDITLIGAAFDINASSSINAGTGDIYVAPSQATAMTISATADNLSNAEIGRFTTSGTIHIGTATTGPTGSGGAGSSISATSITVSEALSVGGSASLDFDSSGTTTLGANVSTAAGDITFSDAVTLTAAVTVDSDSNSDSTDGEIEFSSTINGAFALTLDADTGSVELSGAVGGTTALASLSATGGGISLGANVTTTGAVDFNSAVTLAASATVSSGTGAGDISFDSTVDGGHALTATAGSGTVTFGGVVGGTTALTSLSATGGGISLGANVTTTGAVDFNSAVTLAASATVSSGTGAGNISFDSTVNGGHTLTVTAGSGTVTFGGVVGGTTALTSLSATGGGISLGANVTTTGAVDFNSAVTLAASATVSSGTGAGNISFDSTVNGGHALTVTAGTGSVTFSGAVGGTTALTGFSVTGGSVSLKSVRVTGTGTISVTGSGGVTLSGVYRSANRNIDFNSAVTLAGAVTVNSGTGAGNIAFDSTVNGGHALTVTAGTGTVTFSGAVGGSTKLSSLTVDGGQIDLDTVATTGAIDIDGTNIDLNGGSYTSNQGSIDFRGPVALTVNVRMDSDADNSGADGNIRFHSTVDGAKTLTLDADSGSVTLSGAVGGSTELTSLTVTGGAVSLRSVETTGAISVTGSSGITLNGNYLSDGEDITFTGAVALAGAVTVDSDADNSGADGNIAFSSTINGGRTLTLDANTGSVTLSGAAGGTTRLTSLTVDGGQIALNSVSTTGVIDIDGSNIDLNGTAYTSSDGDIDFRAAVDLHANVRVNSDADNDGTDGDITFHSTVDGGHTLTLDADGGSVGQTGAVGGTTRLTSLTIDGGQIDLNTVATTGLIDIGGSNIDLNAGSYTSNDGNIIFRGAVDLHANVMVNSDEDDDSADGNITFTWTIDGAHTLTLDADTGSVELRGAVGGGTKLTSLTVDGGQIDLNSVATTGAIDIEGTNIDLNGTTYESDDGNITFTGPVDLHARDASVTVDSDADNDAANGNITFSSTIDGGYALTLDADVNGGDITVGGTVGGTTPLASFTPIGGAVSLNGVNVSGDFHLNAEEMVMGGHYGSDDGDFTLTGRVILDGAVTVNTDRDGDGDGGDIIFSAAIDGGYALTLNADTGSVTLTGPVGGTTPLASLTVNGGRIDLNTVATTGAIDIVGTNIALNGESYTSEDGDIDFSGAVYLHTDVSMDSDADDDRTDGSIRFTSTLDGGHALTLNADGGNIDFDGDVGSVDKLGAMTVTKAHDVTVATEMNVVSFTQLAGTGTTNFGSNTIHADAFVDVSTRDMYGRIVTQDARLKASNFIGVNVKVGTLTFKARDADINGTVGGNDGQAAADHTMVNNRGPGSYKLNGFTILGTGPGTRTYAELSALPLSRTMESAGHPATPADAVYPTYIPMLRASVMDAIDSPYAVNVYEMQFPLLTPRPGTESWYDELPGVVRGL